jgi:DNA-binding transcriptional LysR family regulator
VELLRRGAVDLAVTGLRDEHERDGSGLAVTVIADEPLRVIGAPDEPLLHGGELAVDDLRGAPLILAERQTALRDVVTASCVAAGFSPVPLFEVGDPAAVRFLAHAGLGVAAVPASWLDLPGPEVGSAALAEPAPRHRVALLAPPDGPTPAGRMLAEHVRSAV